MSLAIPPVLSRVPYVVRLALLLCVAWSGPAAAATPPGFAPLDPSPMIDVRLLPPAEGIVIGRFQNWQLRVRDAAGRPVEMARFVIDGGMRAHGHGLPTRPRVTAYLGEGRYRIEGVKLSMSGLWQFVVTVETPYGRARVEFEFDARW